MTTKSNHLHRKTKLASLVDQVYERLRTDIISGELRAGEKLVELEIATQMGTSQGPVREALQRLERDGLVDRQARSATYVTDNSIDQMYELFFIRNAIEGFAISRTVQHITYEQVDELQRLVDRMAEAGRQNDIVAQSEFDMEFHRLICEWSGSATLMLAWSPLFSQIQRFVVQSHPKHYPDLVEVGTRHQPIVDALRNHDENAREILQKHIMLIWSEISP